MRRTVFVRVLASKEKPAAVQLGVAASCSGEGVSNLWALSPSVFAVVPGSPFSYNVSPSLRQAYERFHALEGQEAAARQGLATGDDFRFVRMWWEVEQTKIVAGVSMDSPKSFRQQTREGRPWVPFAKGGTYSPYYADLHLVLNWKNDGEEIAGFDGAVIRNPDFYFRPGITFPRRTRRICPKALPAGSIFGHGGQGVFAEASDVRAYVGLLASSTCHLLSLMLVGTSPQDLGGTNPQFETGVVQRLPIPSYDSSWNRDISALVDHAMRNRRLLDQQLELTHGFVCPLVTHTAVTLADAVADRVRRDEASISATAEVQQKLDSMVATKYGIPDDDLSIVGQAAEPVTAQTPEAVIGPEASNSDDEHDVPEKAGIEWYARLLLSYAVGCTFGRWDIRYATGEKTAPELPDPFAPLPVCSPGMLQGEDGLPLTAAPTGYPLHINWNGILVDESNHSDDIVKRVREILHVLWPATSDSIETEMCDALGVKDLRDYFRKPGSGGFWMDHVHMYSKSHRKAPIYWFLQSSHKSYGIWLYYQRLDSDLLFKVLQNYVEPKLKLEQNHEAEASHQLTAGGLSVSETRQAQKDLEKQQDLVAEIREFRDTLKKAADLRLTPELDDGVVLNIASLHDLAPWSEASKYWDDLLAGKYPWSSIGKQLEQKGMV